MSDDIKLNGQCEHGYPADGTCPYCHPAKDRPAKHGNDDIKQAAGLIVRTWSTDTEVVRAYLALREQVDTVALPILRRAYRNHSPTCPECRTVGREPSADAWNAELDAAIKSIEEGLA
jgi:hypothetical protein